MKNRRYIPLPLSPVKIQFSGIPKGYLGTRKTLEHIQGLIHQGAKDFYVRQWAIDILLARGIRPKDYLGEINTLFEWVQRNIRYTRDTFRVEVLHTARRMLQLRAGDCDDMTILLGAMLESIGHPVRLVIMGSDPKRPRFFSHIYLEVNQRGRWIPLDTTMPFPMGWAPRAMVKEIVHLDRGSMEPRPLTALSGSKPMDEYPDWLSGLVFDIGHRKIEPGDPRTRRLIAVLKEGRVYPRSLWMQRFLEFVLRNGLKPGWRTNTIRRLLANLVRYKLFDLKNAQKILHRHLGIRRNGHNRSGGLELPPFRQRATSRSPSDRSGFG